METEGKGFERVLGFQRRRPVESGNCAGASFLEFVSDGKGKGAHWI
jgi:hypothetical protein